MKDLLFSGSMTALITPFTTRGAIDYKSFQELVSWQIDQGTHGLIPCGTTGESPTLNDVMSRELISLTVDIARSTPIPVLAGCGSNDTAHAIYLTRQAQSAGANGALHVTPYYNKPSQEGLYHHFKAIHDATRIPIVLYNVPSRTNVDLSVDTTARLAKLPRIAGIKDASGDLTRPAEMREKCGEHFILLSGNDDTALDFLEQGGVGCISVVSNVMPKLCAQMHEAWQEGNTARAQEINKKLQPLVKSLFMETSPAPVKYAAHLMGLCENELKLPMLPVRRETQRCVKAALENLSQP